jgi:uncharacterized membrane protein
MIDLLCRRSNLLTAVAAGLLLYLATGFLVERFITRFLIGWDGGLATFLGLSFRFMKSAKVADMKERAIEHAMGDRLVLAAALLASIASLGAVVAELSGARGYAPRLMLVAATVALSWLFVQVIFAMHYANQYYRAEAGGSLDGGLAFGAEGNPDYWDFFHFAVVLGACSQTADISFRSRKMRHIGTLHTLVAFAFNTVVLATMINLAADLV